MTSVEEALREFEGVFGGFIADTPSVPPVPVYRLRQRLIHEEFLELDKAMECDDLVEIADGLADLTYVLVGTALAYGIPFDAVFAEVHRSNMAKADGGIIRDPQGKILKPASWTPPNLKGVLDGSRTA